MRNDQYKIVYNNSLDVFQIMDDDDNIYYSDYLLHICETICKLMNSAYFQGVYN